MVYLVVFCEAIQVHGGWMKDGLPDAEEAQVVVGAAVAEWVGIGLGKVVVAVVVAAAAAASSS